MRDFAAEIRDERCWDQATEQIARTRGMPVDDCVLQTRGELIAFCEWIEQNEIRSYLEIGVWTGRLFLLLNRLFRFEKAAACDLGFCRVLGLPFHLDGTSYPVFLGDSHSPEYRDWLASQGRFDLILIDGDHSYPGIRADFETNRASADRFIAFHDITGAGRRTEGVKRFWDGLEGRKIEIVRPHEEIGQDASTMGIGIWSPLVPGST
jgi:hypothetical protein